MRFETRRTNAPRKRGARWKRKLLGHFSWIMALVLYGWHLYAVALSLAVEHMMTALRLPYTEQESLLASALVPGAMAFFVAGGLLLFPALGGKLKALASRSDHSE
jgi:hypothetical protein